jgi:hypothetical protein
MCVLQVIDAAAIHGGRPSDHAMDEVPLFEKELGQV